MSKDDWVSRSIFDFDDPWQNKHECENADVVMMRELVNAIRRATQDTAVLDTQGKAGWSNAAYYNENGFGSTGV